MSPNLTFKNKSLRSWILISFVLLTSFTCLMMATLLLSSKLATISTENRTQAATDILGTTAAGDKYTMKQRFGFGMATQICKNMECPYNLDYYPEYKTLGASWYYDWSFGQPNNYQDPADPNKTFYYGRPRSDAEFMAIFGAYHTGWTKEQICSHVTDVVNASPDAYPDNMSWSFGNEIGWDDDRTAIEYADDFVYIYDCLKNLNPTFKVGSGAIIGPYHILTGETVSYSCATSLDDSRSGYQYFNTYINRIKNTYGTTKLPDFIVAHAYTFCGGTYSGWRESSKKDINEFKEAITLYRQQMKNLGMQNKDLIIKEFGPLYESQQDFEANMTAAQLKTYTETAIKYMADTKDTSIGNPDDNYRLVQKWAYPFFAGYWNPSYYFDPNNTLTSYNYLGMFEQFQPGTQTPLGPITALGTMYKNLITTYTAPATATPIQSQTATPTIRPTSTPTRSLTPTPSPTPTPRVTATPTIRPTSTPTRSLTPTPSPTPTPRVTATPTIRPTSTPTRSLTPTPTRTPTPRVTATPTIRPTSTPTRSLTPTSTKTPTPRPTATTAPVQLLSNNTLSSTSGGWTFFTSGTNATGTKLTSALTIKSNVDKASGCWWQSISATNLVGKRIYIKGTLKSDKTPTTYVPYISINFQRTNNTWNYNYGGIKSLASVTTAANTYATITGASVLIPMDAKLIQVNFCSNSANKGITVTADTLELWRQ